MKSKTILSVFVLFGFAISTAAPSAFAKKLSAEERQARKEQRQADRKAKRDLKKKQGQDHASASCDQLPSSDSSDAPAVTADQPVASDAPVVAVAAPVVPDAPAAPVAAAPSARDQWLDHVKELVKRAEQDPSSAMRIYEQLMTEAKAQDQEIPSEAVATLSALDKQRRDADNAANSSGGSTVAVSSTPIAAALITRAPASGTLYEPRPVSGCIATNTCITRESLLKVEPVDAVAPQ